MREPNYSSFSNFWMSNECTFYFSRSKIMSRNNNNIVNSTFGEKEYNVNMAATILTGLVPLVVYFVSGKLFVRGIAAGAVKG